MFAFLRAFLPCRHEHRFRERRDAVLHLTCDACGDSVPVVITDSKKLRKLQKQWQASRAWTSEKKPKGVIVGMPKVRRQKDSA